jgi:hypothetical protein
VVNVANVQATGITLEAIIPDSANADDSSPSFVNEPFIVECTNMNFTFDYSAVDSDSDSIAYSTYTPLEGASSSVPAPVPASAPPYAPISWAGNYSQNNIFGNGSFLIDSVSGLLTGVAQNAGLYVYGISAKEFRNGQLIGETRRDFQVNIITPNGIDESANEPAIRILPDPVHDMAVIRLKSTEHHKVSLEVYNAIGVKVRSINFSGETIFTTSGLPGGIYFYSLTNSDSLVTTGKFAIE